MRSLLACLLLCVMTFAPAFAQVKVFLNNKPFQGQVAGTPADLLLEAAPFFAQVGGAFVYDAASGKGTLDGVEVPVTLSGETPMVKAREFCAQIGGRYNYSAELGTVDVYAFDPVATARKALARVLALRKVTGEADFNVLVLLSRQILERDLGMKLDFPVEIYFADDPTMKKHKGSGKTAVVNYYQTSQGGGTGRYTFHVRQGMSPIETLEALAWSWGFTWTQLQGSVQGDLAEGAAMWTGFKVMNGLAGPISESSYLSRNRSYKTSWKEAFSKLVEIERTGDTAAVLNHIQQVGGKGR